MRDGPGVASSVFVGFALAAMGLCACGRRRIKEHGFIEVKALQISQLGSAWVQASLAGGNRALWSQGPTVVLAPEPQWWSRTSRPIHPSHPIHWPTSPSLGPG